MPPPAGRPLGINVTEDGENAEDRIIILAGRAPTLVPTGPKVPSLPVPSIRSPLQIPFTQLPAPQIRSVGTVNAKTTTLALCCSAMLAAIPVCVHALLQYSLSKPLFFT